MCFKYQWSKLTTDTSLIYDRKIAKLRPTDLWDRQTLTFFLCVRRVARVSGKFIVISDVQ